MPAPKSPAPRKERIEVPATAAEIAVLDALRGHETRAHYLMTRAGIRPLSAPTAPACPAKESQ